MIFFSIFFKVNFILLYFFFLSHLYSFYFLLNALNGCEVYRCPAPHRGAGSSGVVPCSTQIPPVSDPNAHFLANFLSLSWQPLRAEERILLLHKLARSLPHPTYVCLGGM